MSQSAQLFAKTIDGIETSVTLEHFKENANNFQRSTRSCTLAHAHTPITHISSHSMCWYLLFIPLTYFSTYNCHTCHTLADVKISIHAEIYTLITFKTRLTSQLSINFHYFKQTKQTCTFYRQSQMNIDQLP